MKPKLPFYLAIFVATSTMAFLPMAVKAQSSETTADCVSEPEDYIAPGSLAMMAYRGAFKEEGIPSYNALANELRQGSITAEDIVQAAIQGCVLSNKYGMAENENYVKEVEQQIKTRFAVQ